MCDTFLGNDVKSLRNRLGVIQMSEIVKRHINDCLVECWRREADELAKFVNQAKLVAWHKAAVQVELAQLRLEVQTLGQSGATECFQGTESTNFSTEPDTIKRTEKKKTSSVLLVPPLRIHLKCNPNFSNHPHLASVRSMCDGRTHHKKNEFQVGDESSTHSHSFAIALR
eukprot:c17813_g1_i1.p1 GENE.c17813_g1_i1~~c17813_g1_i1.p1  ORF type:complete len:170 (-),score=14.42 c17813_g1_i1:33-542(-)